MVYYVEDSSLLSQDASLLINLFYSLVACPRRTAIHCSSSSSRIFRPLFPLAALLPVQGKCFGFLWMSSFPFLPFIFKPLSVLAVISPPPFPLLLRVFFPVAVFLGVETSLASAFQAITTQRVSEEKLQSCGKGLTAPLTNLLIHFPVSLA